MANLFINDDGSNTAPYETWAKAAATHATAVSAGSAGDDFIVGSDHSEDVGAGFTLIFPGTAASPNRLISSTVGAGSTIVYNKADNIQLSTGAGGRDMALRGHCKPYGWSIFVGRDLSLQTNPIDFLFDDCLIELNNASSNFTILTSTGQVVVELKNTIVNFSAATNNSRSFSIGGGVLKINGGSVSWTGTQPIALFNGSDRTSFVNLGGFDLSAITSALVDVSDAADMNFSARRCPLNSGVALSTGTINSAGTKVLMSGCDDTTGNDLNRLEYIDYWGSTVNDAAIFLNASNDDGSFSWKMVSLANAREFSEPTKSPPIPGIRIASTGEKTITVNIVWDSASDIQDDEAWVEVEYLEASADTGSAFADDRMADITATPVDQDNNAESWAGTGGFTNENTQELAVTVTINRVGPLIVRVCLAKPSTTIYVDPKVVIS